MRRYLFPALLCATLGLAPYTPEPHIVGKLRWLLGGGEGMTSTDWFDLAMHGLPFVWLLAVVGYDLLAKPKHRISGERAHELVDAGALLVDVRTPQEFAASHLDGAVNVPVSDLPRRVGELPTDRALVMYCASGMRSARALHALKKTGRVDVFDLGSHRNW